MGGYDIMDGFNDLRIASGRIMFKEETLRDLESRKHDLFMKGMKLPSGTEAYRQTMDGLKNINKKIEALKNQILNHRSLAGVGTVLSRSKNLKIYRGESDTTGTHGATYGKGLYTTTNIKTASEFGKAKEMPKESLPINALRFHSINDFQIWEGDVLYKILKYRNKREFTKDYPDFRNFIRDIDPAIDGIQIGSANDADFVKYTS